MSANTAARATAASRDGDDRADARAISAIAKRLRPRNPTLGQDDLTEKATDFYAGMCQKAISGQLPPAAFAQFATLVGEDADELKARIQRGQEEIAKDPTRALFIVTHDPRIMPFADRILRIEDGRIVDDQRRDERTGTIHALKQAS